MKIVILGAGAVGSIIGGHLARAGEEVTIIARGQRAAYVQQHGITLTGLADFTVPVAVTTQPQTVHEADVLVMAVKTYDIEQALASVRHIKVGSVLSIQNGVLKNEQLAHVFGWDKTLGAAVVLSGEVTPAGSILQGNTRIAIFVLRRTTVPPNLLKGAASSFCGKEKSATKALKH